MTAWQDQPPVSRRQVRQNERGDAVDSQVSLAQNPTDQPDFGPFPREGWNSDARAAVTPEPPERADGVVVRGRRAQLQFPSGVPQDQDETAEEAPDGVTPEPLSYITQARPQVPSYDGPSFRNRSISAVPDQTEETSPASSRTDGARQPYRVRDFSPESRRSTFTSVPRPQGSTPPTPLDDEPGVLDYHTQAEPVSEQASPPPASEAVTHDEMPHDERTITRRELRALQQNSDPLPFDAPSSHTTSADQIRIRERVRDASLAPETGQVPQQADALAEFDALAAAQPFDGTEPPALVEPPRLSSFPLFVAPAEPKRAAVEEPDVEQGSEPVVDESVFVASTGSDASQDVVSAEIVEDEAHNLPDFDALLFQAPRSSEDVVDVEPVPAPADVEEKPFGLLLNEPETQETPEAQEAPEESYSPPREAHEAYTPPVGHWSTQASIDDDQQVQDNSFSRNVGVTSGAITTNALVLPSIPTVDDILSPLSSTGEILITGSINLPSSMGTTGALPARYDHSDVDALLAADDREDSSDPDSAPVRAIRAISTHTSSGPVITTVKPKSNNRMLTVVAVSAAVVAAGIVALLIAGVIFKIF
jgi:hypothetical protein